MPRLLGVEIPADKKVAYALRYIYGIGPTRSVQVMEWASIDPHRRARELTEEDLNKITDAITSHGVKVEGDVRREVVGNIKRLQGIRCYRGLRHMRGLPVRGQRTRTNARTRKGARKTVGVVKKKE
ncbi:MAG: 30S ribosomal protein S13 [Puniceicoccales bacterium]|nr:30S ribosomal protein S13 [Puniceicoccales bacterium]